MVIFQRQNFICSNLSKLEIFASVISKMFPKLYFRRKMERNLEIHLKPAIIWHLQNLVKNLTNKMMSTSLPEFDKVLEQSPDGEEYRTHLVRILLKEIDFQGNRQKESVKINLLKPNLQKIMESPYFLSHYVFEIFLDVKDIADFYGDILRHLKLKVSEQLIFCLGIYIFSMNSKDAKSIKILKQKLKEWFEFEKDGELPSYAVYQILNAIKSEPELSEDTTFSMNIREFLVQQNVKSMKEESMNAQKLSSIFECNRTNSLYKYENETKNNTEFKFVEK